jgi:DNA-nicking Smr family endonuclease
MDSGKKNEEYEDFRQAMADVTPLPSTDRIEPVARKTPPRAVQREKDDREVLQELLELDAAAEELLFLRPGQQKRVLRRLRRGHYSIADSVDLHHMNVATAKQILLEFLDHALKNNMGCVRIIHGKGLRSKNLPRIKMMTGRVLRKHPRVLAFASCRAVDGGTGATAVLLSAAPGKQR